ncbi:uncharacterized protein PgNI_08758 [Pyricularia grisea]|uniref:Uncharacterized protein n=1 Tax=Pyricularia grisea TaxID=148305 RepID=A0A6P8AVQ3_PYRGI|nr:uncharacterized protein PgNI_08758 [Pyricularia grisea]TLD06308.1 hypothetical protein PgNI_08758 [Pyricularia grisea]
MAAISKSDHVLDLFMKLLPPARFAYLPTEILFPSTLSFEIEYITVDLDLKVSKYTAFQEDLQRPRIPTYLASEYSSWRSYLWNDRIIGSPVIGAIVLNNEHGVQRLLDRGYKVDRTCLYIAVMINSLSMVKLILCALNSIKGIQANEEIREHGQSRIYDIIQIGFNPINWAVRANNKKMVQLLLQAGERIDRDFYDTREAKFDRLSPLQTAVTMRNIDLVAWLIGCGADVNGPPCPYAGSTAISVAAAHGDLAIARLLVENGTRVNTLRSPYRREYLTAFEYAQQGGHHVAANIIKAHRTWETFDLAMLENISVKFSSEGQEFANEILPDECRKVISPNEPCLCFGCYPQELGDEWSDDEDTWEDTVGDSGEDLIVLEDGVQAGSLRPWAPEHIIGDHESQGWVSSFPNFDEIDIEPGQRFPTQFLSETEASILDSATAEWDDTHVQHAANSEHPSLADGPLAEPSVPTVVDEAQHNWVVASSDQELGREGADNIESLEQDLFGPLEFNWEF